MAAALDEVALENGDVPVGATIVDGSGMLLPRGATLARHCRTPPPPTPRWSLYAPPPSRLTGLTLVVTLEPCNLRARAACLAEVDRIVYGAPDPKAGAAGSLWDVVRDRRLNRRPEVIGGVREAECAALLSDFFTIVGPGRSIAGGA